MPTKDEKPSAKEATEETPSPTTEGGGSTTDRARRWLTSNVTITLPGWAYAATGLLFLILLIGAL